jgi:hypothetical protein
MPDCRDFCKSFAVRRRIKDVVSLDAYKSAYYIDGTDEVFLITRTALLRARQSLTTSESAIVLRVSGGMALNPYGYNGLTRV